MLLSKKQLREQMLRVRAAIAPRRRETARQKATRQLPVECRNAQTVVSFASFGDEINLWSLNDILAQEGRLALPCVSQNGNLTIYKVDRLDGSLVRSSWGVLEPNPCLCKEVSLDEIEVVLVPGLGFDPPGNRLGYGKGCYDRFLSQLISVTTIGVGFLEQSLIDPIPIEPFDVRLDEVLLF